ncbi:MAG: tetratricopeptide repeat protein, partial [Minisyncoccia bacterium]
MPATMLPLGVSKAAIASLGVVIIFLVFLYETLKQGKLVFPSAYVLWGVFALPLVYLASGLTGLSQKVSIFGYNFEPGTFGSILILSVLFGVLAVVLVDSGKILRVYGAMLLSLAIISLFALVKVFSGGKALEFGAFSGVMGNPIGAWTDYAMMFGLTSLISLFALEILPMKATLKKIVYGLLAVSVFMLVVINFSTAWELVFVGSLVAVVYFMTIEKRFGRMDGDSSHTNMGKFSLPLIVMIIALLFVFNPNVSGTQGGIGNTISGAFGVNNSDVRPALSTTFSVVESSIKAHPLLGSGPNTFDRDWLMYKPAVINSTTFWNAAFPFGFGFLPTQIGATGILGTLVWILFFIVFLWIGGKALARNSENKAERFIAVSSFIGSIFLWLAMFMYVPSMTVLAFAFIFTGICVASSGIVGAVKHREVFFAKNMILNFVSVLLMIILGLGTASLGFVSLQKTLSVVHFEKALVLSNTKDSKIEDVEAQIANALNLSQEDIYYSAISQLEFSKAQGILNSTTGTPEQNRQDFQTAIQKSILGAQGAININPGNYQNWITLGSLYGALVPKPLSIPGAYDNAKTAYQEALKRNPQTPEASLFLAKLEFDNGNNEAARKYIDESLAKKQD